jgi:hypothetical protein
MSRPVLIDFDENKKRKTALTIRELHPSSKDELLNEEWMVLENTSANSLSVRGCSLTVAENAHRRPHALGQLEPGFILEAGASIRLVTGSPAKKSQGAPPAETDELKNYHLFLKGPYLTPGVVVRLTMRQLDLAAATFAPDQPGGVGAV